MTRAPVLILLALLPLLGPMTTTSAIAADLSLRQALISGLSGNFDLRIAGLDVERAAAAVTGEESRFDTSAELAINTRRSETPTDSPLTASRLLTTRQTRAEVALSRQFASGLQTRLGLATTRSNSDELVPGIDPVYRTALLLDLSQPLLKDFGFSINNADLQIARTRQQQAALALLDSAQQLAYRIELAYLELAQAEVGLGYAVAALDLAKELLRGNQRKLEIGLIPATEVTEARTAVAAREENVLLYRQRVARGRNQLLDLIDHDTGKLSADWQVVMPASDDQRTPGLEQALALGRQERPDLGQARLDLDISGLALTFAGNQKLPRLDLEASLGLQGLAGQGEDSSRYPGGWADSFDDHARSWYAGLRLQAPLENRQADARYRDAFARDSQDRYRLRRLEKSAEAEIRSAHATLELGAERLAVARHSAELARLTLDQENRRLSEGLSDTFRVLSFQNALLAAQLSELAALSDYHRAQAELSFATGTILARHDIGTVLPTQGAIP